MEIVFIIIIVLVVYYYLKKFSSSVNSTNYLVKYYFQTSFSNGHGEITITINTNQNDLKHRFKEQIKGTESQGFYKQLEIVHYQKI